MGVLDREAIYISFLEQLKNADQRILLLDYDGTMAPFHKDRTHAFPYPEIPPLLTEIMKAGTRLVLVTGRPSRELVMLSGLYPHPEIWGSHGLERLMPNGDYSVVTLPGKEEAALLKSADVVRALGYEANLELKPGGVAVHWRGLEPADAEKLRGKVSQKWKPLIEDHALKLLEFDGGLEIKSVQCGQRLCCKEHLKGEQSGRRGCILRRRPDGRRRFFSSQRQGTENSGSSPTSANRGRSLAETAGRTRRVPSSVAPRMRR